MSRATRRLLQRAQIVDKLTEERAEEHLRNGSNYVVMWGSQGRSVLAVLKRKGVPNEEFLSPPFETWQGVGTWCAGVVDSLIARGIYKARDRDGMLGDVRGALELHGWSWEGRS